MTVSDVTVYPLADELRERGWQAIAGAQDLLQQIERATAPFGVQNVLEPLNELSRLLSNSGTECSLLSETHPDLAVREAAEAVERDLQDFETRLLQNRRLYDALCAVDTAAFDEQTQRLVRLSRQDMEREGVALEDAKREQVRTLRSELLEVEQAFGRNIRDDVRRISVDPADLDGLPEDYVRAHAPGAGGTVTITTNYPDAIPFFAYARSGSARKALMAQYNNRAVPGNLDLLSRMLEKRHALATLLGFESWADYTTQNKMAGSAETVRAFIRDAYEATRESAAAEMAQLLEMKRQDEPGAATIGEWELSYYTERVKAQTFQFDTRTVRPYFEYHAVRNAIFELNAELFGLTFMPVAADRFQPWHPSVETFDVAADGVPIGRMSLDMHPREGKFKHAACFTLRTGVAGKQDPHFVLVCNFPDPDAQPGGQPALLEHREVVTYFHEFGHLIHGLMRGNIPWVRLGPIAERDFVEAPSQFLEEYIFDATVLRRFARHVETGELIAEETVRRLRQARDFGRGVAVQRQLFFSAVSLQLHDRDPQGLDTTALLFDLARQYAPFELLPDTHFQASFGHLQGYTAAYYTYMWSLAISKDFLRAFEQGLLDTRQARRYRDLVLAPGGSKPAGELVRDFLGRPSNLEAFRAWLAPQATA